jgi:flavin reductase
LVFEEKAMIDGNAFKSGMRRLAAGVTVVTTVENGLPHGLVVTSTSSVSVEPVPSLLVCVNHSASCHDVIMRSGIFCANVLSSEDIEIAQRFANAQHRDKRFEGSIWTSLVTGAPAITSALVSFDCRVARHIDVHSHTVFVGEVEEMRLWKEELDPLLYFEGRYENFRSMTDRSRAV